MRHAQQPSCCRSTDCPTEFLRQHRSRETETCCASVELPLAVICYIRQHRPQERNSRCVRHLRKDIEGIDKWQIIARYEDQREEDTRHDGGHDIDGFVAETFGKRFGRRQSDNQRHGSEHIEELHILRVVDIILEVISDRSILHRKHDKRHDTHTRQHDPCLIHKQVLEIFQYVAVLFFRLRHTLFGGCKSDKEESDTQHTEQAHRILVSLRLIHYAVITDGTKPFDEIQRCAGNDKLTDIRCDKTISIQSRTLVGVIRHDRRKRTVRQVHKRISRTQQETGNQRISELTIQSELRRRKCQYCQNGVWYRTEQQIRTELTPAAVRAVGDNTHHRIHDRIPDTADKHDHTCQSRTQTIDVRIENQQPETHQVPHKMGRGIT